MKRELGASQRANRTVLKRTIFLMVLCGFVVFIPLVGSLYNIQIVKHDFYESKAVQQQTRDTVISPLRGTIYDRNMKTLAMSASVDTIFISPVDIKTEEQRRLVVSGLSQILEVDEEDVLEKTKKKNYYQTIKKKIEKNLSDQVRAYASEKKLENIIHVEPDYKRYYPYATLAANVIGFVGDDNQGLEGVEAIFDSQLKGLPGRVIAARNAEGVVMPFQYEKYYDAQNGLDFVLTIDETIQHFLEKHLETAVIEQEVANRAAGIVMDVKTGEILAMSTMSGYDLNNPRVLLNTEQQNEIDQLSGEEKQNLQLQYQFNQWRNKMVSDTYEPGSTFKIITTAIAIEQGVVKDDDQFSCSGSIRIAGWGKPIRCHKVSGHGAETFAQGVQNSCNPVFVTVGQRVGSSTFYDYVKAFGFMEKTGISLPGESGSVMHSAKAFNDVALAAYSFGQTFNITPIQLVTAVSAVANGGYLMKPHIVKETIDAEGNVQTIKPEVVRQVISSETSKHVCNLLEQVVSLGTGKNAYVKGYRIAGKTGTSQKRDPATHEYMIGKYIVSFVGFAPADDPQIAIFVMLDEPMKGPPNLRSGGGMAAPVVGRIMADVLPYLNVEPQYEEGDAMAQEITIPNVVGKLSDAKKMLDEKNISFEIIGDDDTITRQVPSAGARVPGTAKMILYTGNAAPESTVTVPDVVGKTAEQANKLLVDAGLYMRAIGATAAHGGGIVAGRQSVPPGSTVAPGLVIEVEFIDNNLTD